LPAALFVCSILLTIIAWYISHSHLVGKTRERFEYEAGNVHSAVEVRMAAYEQVLRSAVGLFNAADPISRSEWRRYVQTLRLQEAYPGILGLGYAERVRQDDLARFTRRVQAEGFPDFSVWPDEPREEYFPILYLEPFEGRNLRAFGYDMYTEEKRREAMERARNSRLPSLSKMVILVQETNQDVQKGCLLYLPVYNETNKTAATPDRQAALKGFVYSPFRINDLMKGILGKGSSKIALEIYDGTTTDTANLFYSSHASTAKPRPADFSASHTIHVGGNTWTLVFRSNDRLLSSLEATQPNIIAIAGILVNLLLWLILSKVNSLSRHNKILAERYKVEKDRYEIVADSTNDIFWEWDIGKNQVSFNNNYQLVLGHELPGGMLSYEGWMSHVHAEDRERVSAARHTVLNTGKRVWSEEYRLLKLDGSSIHILDRGRVIYNRDASPVRMVGSMINITERKQAEEAQRSFREELEKTVLERTVELRRSNEDLERFAHVASHDLKEPVRKILTYSDRIKTKYEHVLGEGSLLLDKLTKSASRLNQMIDSILIFSTVNSESHAVETVDMNVTVENAIDDLELIIAEKGADIQAGDLPVIEGSSVLLHQLFYNLLNNALKFSRAGVAPVIKIESQLLAGSDDGQVEFKIIDNGIGFSEMDAKKIFKSFVRLHPKDRFEGTGLGLALCKRIVERHSGQIEAHGSIGGGAIFLIRLPVRQASGTI